MEKKTAFSENYICGKLHKFSAGDEYVKNEKKKEKYDSLMMN